MIADILARNEGKTIEFKESSKSLVNVVRTAVAFANTAGGIIVIGIEDKTKKIVGVSNPLQEEERIANVISDSIAPLMIPDIEILTYRGKEIIIVNIYHSAGPFYIKAQGLKKGTLIRFGSTNRVVDAETLKALQDYARNKYFDETPCLEKKISNLDWPMIQSLYKEVNKKMTPESAESIGLITQYNNKEYPSYGAIILFGSDRLKLFPEAKIRCARFLGNDRITILDRLDIETYLPIALDEALKFIRRNTSMGAKIGDLRRVDIPQYPPIAVRESIINAIVHAEYAIKGIPITIAIFNDRIEITNPGALPFGLTMEKALAGASRIRNRVIAKVFYQLKFIEQWGTGLRRIIDSCLKNGLESPQFEELNNQFRVTIFALKKGKIKLSKFESKLIAFLKKHGKITTKEAAAVWGVTTRTARLRLIKLVNDGIIVKTGTGLRDPRGGYLLV